MEHIAAGRAAEKLLAEHKANLRFKPLGPPDAPAAIPDAYDIQDKYVALLRLVETSLEPTPSRSHKRGVSRSSRTLGAGCGGRGSVKRRMTLRAHGEVVWSWRPDAGVKFRGAIRATTVAKKPGHRGEHGISR